MMFGRARLWVLRLALAEAVLLLALGGLEIAMRVIEPRVVQPVHAPDFSKGQASTLYEITPRGRRLAPNTANLIQNHPVSKQDVVVTVNSAGFRDREVAPDKPAAETRILALGDSITLSAFLPPEQTWVQRAEFYLNRGRSPPQRGPAEAGPAETRTDPHGIVEPAVLGRTLPEHGGGPPSPSGPDRETPIPLAPHPNTSVRSTAFRRSPSPTAETGALPWIEVINAGLDGIGLREEIELLEECVTNVRPDVALIGFYLNDTCQPDRTIEALGEPGWLRRHSVLADAIYRRVMLRRLQREGPPKELQEFFDRVGDVDWKTDPRAFDTLVKAARGDWGAAWTDEAMQTARRELQRLKSLAARHGFRPALVLFPVSFQVEAPFDTDAPQLAVARIARDLDIPCLDLLPVLRAYGQFELFFDWCHPRPETSDVIGRHVAGFLARRVLSLPEPDIPQATTTELDNAGKTIDLYVLGGSTAAGEPYHPSLDLGRAVSHLFDARLGDRVIHVRNLARVGYSSEDVLRSARNIEPACADSPAVALVYCGHNEFLRYDVDHDLSKQTRMLCDIPTVSAARRQTVLDAYRDNIEQLVRWLREKGVTVILSTLVSNIADWEPNRSVASDLAHRDAIQRLTLQAENEAQADQPEAALAAYRSVLDLEPGFAWAHKRAGDMLRLRGDNGTALEHFLAAKDLDGNPYRALESQNAALREIAREQDVPLADAAAAFAAVATSRLVGFDLIIDNCHPNLRGYGVLAGAFASEIETGLGVSRVHTNVSKSAWEAAFGIDDARKRDIYHSRGQYCYSHSTLIWYPVARLNRAMTYLDLAASLGPTADILVSRAVAAAMMGDSAAVRAGLERAGQLDAAAVRRRMGNPYVRQIMQHAGVEAPGAGK